MTSFIAELKSRLPEADWPVVVAALRSDSQSWAELQDGAFGSQALEAAVAIRARWSPAFLGLLRLGQAKHFESLRATPMVAVSEKLRYEAAAAYEQLASPTDRAEQANPDLAQATLLALALRERRRLLNGWEQLANDLSIASPEFWKLPMACLFGLLPKQHELLETLLAPNLSPELHELAIHALVSNPLTLDVQSAHLMEIIPHYELPQLIALLRSLAQVRLGLAQEAALQALEDLQSAQPENQDGLAGIQRLLLQAEIYQISNQSTNATPLLHSAWEAAQQLQADLAVQVAEASDDDTSALASMQASMQLADPKLKVNTKSVYKRPAALFSAARVALKGGDDKEAVQMALAALQAASQNERVENRREKARLLGEMGEFLLQLRRPQEAEQAAQAALQLQPNDADTANLLADIMRINGKLAEALQHAHLAAALAPQRTELRRNLATALQNAQQPELAFQEWKAVLDQEAQPSLEDWLALAATALASAQIEETIKACQHALALQPANGTAHALMGKALAAQGDSASAIDYLRRATELAPSQGEAWLALADLLQAQGQAQEAIACIHTAQEHTAPSAQMQALLADLICAQDRFEEALPAYQYAAQLAAEQNASETAQQVALKLSALQRQLGQLDAARTTLEAAQKSFPGNPDLARQFGAVLLASGEPKRALASLKMALLASPEDVDILMDLARAQLGTGEQLAEAEQSLRAVLENKSAPAEAKALLAEASAAQGKHGEAVKQFESALKTDLGAEPTWRKRLALGKAQSLAAGGKPVAAINTLEALDKEQADDLDIQRALCATYKQAGRADEAALIAHKVYLSAANSEESLMWYAELMRALSKSAEACKILGRRSQRAELTPRGLLGLSMLQWDGQSKQAALETLAAILKSDDSETLAHAAAFLLSKKAKESSTYYRRAIDLAGPSLDWLDDLTQAYLLNDQLEDALKTVDISIGLAPHKPKGFDLKAELLQRMEKPQAALQALNTALDMLPNEAGLLARKAVLLRATGDWSSALSAAAQAAELDPNHMAYVQSAAELAAICLQPERGQALFAQSQLAGNAPFEAICLQAELALDAGQEIAAAKLLAAVAEEYAAQPRLLALQSQLAACRGDRSQARELLQQGLTVLPKLAEETFAGLGLAKAAEKLNDWDGAIRLYETLIAKFPALPAAHAGLGRAYTLRAEWQQLAEASQATHSLPGAPALAKSARKATQQAFSAASVSAADPAVQATLGGWLQRAELIFGGKFDFKALLHSYPANAGEAAALLAAAQRNGDSATVPARLKSFWSAPEVLVVRAIGENSSDGLDLIIQAAKQLPHSAPVQALAAQAAYKASRPEEALHFIQQALALWPSQPEWQYHAGQLQQAQGRLAEASQHFMLAAELEPQQARYHFALGQAQMAAKLSTAAIQSFQQAVDLQPDQTDYLLALAQAHHRLGDNKQAKSLAQKAHKASPESSAALLLQVELALAEKDFTAAKGLIEQALVLNPKDPAALLLFGETLYALGQAEDAAAVLERAAKASADEVPVLIRRAQFLSQERSQEALVKLSTKHPERAEVFFALSQLLALTGGLAEAVKAAQHAARKAGILPAELAASIHLHLGQLLKQSGNLDQSLHHLDETIRLQPHMLDPYLERGRVFLSRRQHAQALAAFRQAASVAPQAAAPHFEAGLALKDAKDYSAAEAEFRQAARLAPKDRNIQRQLAALIAMNLVHQRHEVGVQL